VGGEHGACVGEKEKKNAHIVVIGKHEGDTTQKTKAKIERWY